MEMANSDNWRTRVATRKDVSEIGRLLGTARLRHLHADWHLPVDWVGTPGFVLCERESASGEPEIGACLAVGADPPPAAWVRVALVKGGELAEQCLREMLITTIPWLRENGVSVLGWLPEAFWPERWLSSLGFQKTKWIITYSLNLALNSWTDTDSTAVLPSQPPFIRPATTSDMARLAEIERDAFEPLWRHSQHGLLLAFRQAVTFDVAELDGRIVGFQYSVAGQDDRSAHLVRLTVAPEAQRRGVGSGLMKAALQGYAKMGAEQITLNTQSDNHASHKLYERFGFEPHGSRAAVWTITID